MPALPLDWDGPPPLGVPIFWSAPFLWFYIYYWIAVGLFAAFWGIVAPHPMWRWSILCSAVILFVIYLDVQLAVATNTWYGPFNDLVQAALGHTQPVTEAQFYGYMLTYGWIAMMTTIINVSNAFLVSHWLFRWRAAMNRYYTSPWPRLRLIEEAPRSASRRTRCGSPRSRKPSASGSS